jgi:hypothetical protein
MCHFDCPLLGGPVELTAEHAAQIRSRHPDFLPRHIDLLRRALRDPDLVRTSAFRAGSRKLSRCYPRELDGRHVVVVVKRRSGLGPIRIVTAYTAPRLIGGHVVWRRS